MCAESKSDYNKLYFLRKIAVARSVQSLMQSKLAFNKAETESLLKHQAQYEKELIKESEAFKNDLLLKQSNKVLDAMSQRISYMKQELSKYKTDEK
jgi:small-conductance mechanosensitive channel